jgi:hypothetical protein
MKKLRTILISLLIAATIHAQTSTTPSGSGTSGSPYQIATVNNLYWLTQTSGAWGSYFTQTADIDASGISNFSPIGNSSTYFTGTYNGNGYTISGLTISRSTTSLVGLFGKTNNATISNLGLTGASVSGFHYTGILAGTCNGTNTISKCFATGTVSSTGSSVGGLIGELASGSTVTNSYAIATVSSTNSSCNIGGLIGFNYGTVSYCYASATVSASGGSIGGLLGNSSTVSTASYYNSGLCSSGSSFATAKSATELQTQSSFSGWDFSSVWDTNSTINSGFPYFIWQRRASTVTTQAVSNISSKTATANGNITYLGIPYPTAYGICWSTTNSTPTISNSYTSKGSASATGAFTVSMTGLTPNSTYYVRTYATNVYSTVYGDVVNFSTPAIAPTINSFTATSITGSSAVINASVNANNLSTVVKLEYDTLSGFTTAVTVFSATISGYSNVTWAKTISIKNCKGYYVRITAINAVDTVTSTLQFTSIPLGSGTSSSPYKITSVGELYWLSQNSSYWGKYFIQTADIDASSISNFSPIGNSTTKFTGNYNGKGYAISGLNISRSSTSYIGLFGYTSGAEITYVRLLKSSIAGGNDVGGVVGYANASTVSYCYNTGTVAFRSNGGGIVGYAYASTVSYCYNTGLVSINTSYLYVNYYIGGIVGVNSGGTVSVCYNTGALYGIGNYALYMGGIVGGNSATVSDCYNTGTISGTGYGSIYMGGIVGWNYYYSSSSSSATVSDCYNTGAISGTGSKGGIVGYNYKTVSDCYWDKQTSGQSAGYSANSGTFSGSAETTAQMKQQSTFSNWDFTSTWTMRDNNIYPALRGVSNNAPFAFADTLYVPTSGSKVSGLLDNDYDYESLQTNLVAQVVSLSSGSVVSGSVFFPATATYGDTITVIYRVGELIAVGDTLWGNQATSTLVYFDKPFMKWAFSGTSSNSIAINGTLINANKDAITAYGFCYSSSDTLPAITGDTTKLGATTAAKTTFTDSLPGLHFNTIYYVRGYIITASDTIYSSVMECNILSSGSGTADDPYRIATLNDLYLLSQNSSIWNKYFIQTADIDADSTHYWNANASGGYYGFSPIGNSTTTFTGHYNGQGHTITNLFMNRSATDYTGLFGYIGSGATVDSLGVSSNTITGQNYTGILAGYNAGAITSCYTSGTVTGGTSVGGFVAKNAGGTISKSYSSATVNGNNDVGALVGDNTNSSTISNCYATGSSIGGTGSSNYTSGGLVGYNASGCTISYCFATGNATGYSHVGGLVGSSGGTITSSFYNKDIFTATTSYGTGLTTSAMKKQSSYSGFDFTNTWEIREDSTYAALRSVSNNAPFAFADTVSGSFHKLLANDYDYETLQSKLVMDIVSVVSLKTGINYTGSIHTIASGDSLSVTYRIGEVLAVGDTLWGNQAKSILSNSTPVPALTSTTLTTAEDTQGKLLLTASHSDGDELVYSILTKSINGAVSISNDSLVYTPNTNFNGSDSIQVAVNDGFLADVAWIHITVTSVDDAPVFASTTLATTEDTQGKLLLASDADGDKLSYTVLTDVVNGTAVIRNDSLVYTPTANFNGSDSLHVSVSDGLLSDTAWVRITVISVNDAPVARDTVMTAITATATAISLPVTDLDGTISNMDIVEYPANGTVVISGTTLTYTSNAGFSGKDTLTWVALDDEGLYSNIATLVITVKNIYTITASAGDDGSISPSGSLSVNEGSGQSFTITANTGYHIADVLVDGSSVGAVSSYTFSSVAANHTIAASFEITSYMITASAGDGGSISPSGSLSMNEGSGQSFTITANTGYHIADVLVDGSSVGAVSSYIFSSVAANHTIAASFEITSYMITASAGDGGSISPSGSLSVSEGSSQSFTVTANTGYHIYDVMADSTSVGAVSSYTFSNVTANHTIVASFVLTTVPVYTITASAGDGGSISPLGSVSVEEGSSQSFTITANSGYAISDVLADGTSVGAVSSYTFSNVTANHTIVASFVLPTVPVYTITASAGDGGSISPLGSVSVEEGSSQSFTITANSGYVISDVLADGTSVGAVSSYTFSSVTANHTIAASFELTTGVENTTIEEINFYPNPTTDVVYITGAKGQVNVYDLSGQLVLTQQINSSGNIQVSSLASGVYVVKVNGKNFKLIKE